MVGRAELSPLQSPQELPCLGPGCLPRPTAGIFVEIWPFSSTRRQIKGTYLVWRGCGSGSKGLQAMPKTGKKRGDKISKKTDYNSKK